MADVESEIEAAHLTSFYSRDEPKALNDMDAPTVPERPIEPLSRPTSSDVAPPQHPSGRVVGEDDHRAAAVASPPSAITPLLPQQPQGQAPLLSQYFL